MKRLYTHGDTMITYVNDLSGNTKIEVTLGDTQELPTTPEGFEWIDVSCIADNLRGVRVLILEKVTK
jgi:hypothetical protein